MPRLCRGGGGASPDLPWGRSSYHGALLLCSFTVSEMLKSFVGPSVLFICSMVGQLSPPDAAGDPLSSLYGPGPAGPEPSQLLSPSAEQQDPG